MHPLSTALILLGSALCLPIAVKFSGVVKTGNRLAFIGNQIGVLIAMAGWLVSGRIWVALIHAVWFAAAQAWFVVIGKNDVRAGR